MHTHNQAATAGHVTETTNATQRFWHGVKRRAKSLICVN